MRLLAERLHLVHFDLITPRLLFVYNCQAVVSFRTIHVCDGC